METASFLMALAALLILAFQAAHPLYNAHKGVSIVVSLYRVNYNFEPSKYVPVTYDDGKGTTLDIDPANAAEYSLSFDIRNHSSDSKSFSQITLPFHSPFHILLTPTTVNAALGPSLPVNLAGRNTIRFTFTFLGPPSVATGSLVGAIKVLDADDKTHSVRVTFPTAMFKSPST